MGKFFTSLFATLNASARAIVAFILPIAKTHAGELLATALPIAEGIVTDLATNQAMPSADKRAAAVGQLKTALVSQGYATASDILSSTLNLAVEMAVNKMQAG